jgi:hypothetical protein
VGLCGETPVCALARRGFAVISPPIPEPNFLVVEEKRRFAERFLPVVPIKPRVIGIPAIPIDGMVTDKPVANALE